MLCLDERDMFIGQNGGIREWYLPISHVIFGLERRESRIILQTEYSLILRIDALYGSVICSM